MEPREILTFVAPGGTFRKADYPWLLAVRVTVRGGDGGGASDGTPGQDGQTALTLLRVEDLPAEVPITVGAGGKGAPPLGKDGADGFVLMELFDVVPDSQT
jgi:hypothetical protein